MERKIRIMLSVGYLAFAFLFAVSLSRDTVGVIFILILVALGIANLQNNLFIQYLAFLLVLFLFLQARFGNILCNKTFATMEPNLKTHLEVVGNAFPGIHGTRFITTDSKGFRVTKPINYKVQSSYRIFAIGGSTTEQIYIDDHKTSYHLLQTRLEDVLHMQVETINTGVSGLRAVNHLATLEEVEQYHPDLIIIMMGGNDWIYDTRKYIYIGNNDGSLIKQSPYIRGPSFSESPLYAMLRFLKIAILDRRDSYGAILRIDQGEWYDPRRNSLAAVIMHEHQYFPSSVSEQYRYYVNEILVRCQEHRYKTLVVSQVSAYQKGASDDMKKLFWMIPHNKRYAISFESMVYIANLYNRFLESEAKRMNFPFCDAASKIPPTKEFFYDDMHLNDRGAKRLSEIIFECMKENNFFMF